MIIFLLSAEWRHFFVRSTHFLQNSVKPLQGTIKMNLCPTRSWSYVSTSAIYSFLGFFWLLSNFLLYEGVGLSYIRICLNHFNFAKVIVRFMFSKSYAALSTSIFSQFCQEMEFWKIIRIRSCNHFPSLLRTINAVCTFCLSDKQLRIHIPLRRQADWQTFDYRICLLHVQLEFSQLSYDQDSTFHSYEVIG